MRLAGPWHVVAASSDWTWVPSYWVPAAAAAEEQDLEAVPPFPCLADAVVGPSHWATVLASYPCATAAGSPFQDLASFVAVVEAVAGVPCVAIALEPSSCCEVRGTAAGEETAELQLHQQRAGSAVVESAVASVAALGPELVSGAAQTVVAAAGNLRS